MSKVVLLSFITLVTMVNPLAVIPSFVALTHDVSRAGRARVALVASMACIVVLTAFLIAGNWVFQFFGITVPAFQIMGGVIFFTNALRTLVQEDERRAYNIGGSKRMEEKDVEKAEVDPSSIAVVRTVRTGRSSWRTVTSVVVNVRVARITSTSLATSKSASRSLPARSRNRCGGSRRMRATKARSSCSASEK